ncbi:MAG: monofunctional biosynthetic peptidoglycan transglycosylase [Acidobacteriota bacterium]
MTWRSHYRKPALLALAALAAAATGLAGWWWRPGVDLQRWQVGPPPAPWAAMRRQQAKWQDEGSRRLVEHEFVPLEEIALDLQLALLVNEDIDFLGHGAIDLAAVREAVQEWLAGRRLRGASTLSQQLAKSLFLSQERSLARKLTETKLAWWLERKLGKRRILELYLNVVEFGPGLFGAEAAAHHYFGVSAVQLDAAQAASLAAGVPSPGRDNPATDSARWAARRAVILRRMIGATWLRERLVALAGSRQSTVDSPRPPP